MRYKEMIEKYELDSKSRKRENVWRRAIITHELRSLNWSFESIGLLFNRDHSTMVHSKRRYDSDLPYSDFKHFRFDFMTEMNTITIKDKLMMCETLEDFQELKNSL